MITYTDIELSEFYRLLSDLLRQNERESYMLPALSGSLSFHLVSNIKSYLRIEYLSINQAFHRIKAKTYGICIETGKLIPKEQLRSVPLGLSFRDINQRLLFRREKCFPTIFKSLSRY